MWLCWICSVPAKSKSPDQEIQDQMKQHWKELEEREQRENAALNQGDFAYGTDMEEIYR